MEGYENPTAERASNPRTSQACQRCRSLKTRCLPSDRQGTCQRCFVSKRDCTWAEVPRKPKRTRGPSRISQVEKKIDGLVANLVSSGPSEQHPTSTSRDPDVTGLSRSLRPLAPGSWLQVPGSFEPVESPQSESNHEIEQNRGYLEKLREIHDFGDDDAPLHRPDGTSFNPPLPKDKDQPIVDDLLKSLVSNGEAEKLLNEYRSMSASFPFVPLVPYQTASGLYATKPMLFLAIMTVASWRDHKLQRSLDKKYRTELATRTVISPRRTLSLFQSMVVYLAWYHFVFSHKTEQIYSLIQLAVGLAMDLGLHQETRRTIAFPGRPEPPPLSPELQRERQRAFLGIYHLSSACSVGLMKPNLLKHSSCMRNCASRLLRDAEYPADGMISGLMALRRIDDEIEDSFYTDETSSLAVTDARIAMDLRRIESLLEDWRGEYSTDDKALELSYAFTDMHLHSISLRPPPPEALQFIPTTPCPSHLKALFDTLEAGKRFLDALLAYPASSYHILPFSEWMRLPHVVVTVLRLCTPNEFLSAMQWDLKAAQDRVRLDLYLESLCYRMQGLSTWDKIKQPHMDFWRAMNMIMDLTKTWYTRKISDSNQASSSGTSTNNLATPETMTSYGQQSSAGAMGSALPGGGFPSMPNMGAAGMDMSGLDITDLPPRDTWDVMKDMDFDMDVFLDMGVWGSEGYESMGFGGGQMRY